MIGVPGRSAEERQKEWDRYVLRLHASTVLSWEECVQRTIEALGLRPR